MLYYTYYNYLQPILLCDIIDLKHKIVEDFFIFNGKFHLQISRRKTHGML